jgi:hypothetical protein
LSTYISAFSIVHATEANRVSLVSADVLAGIYLYEPETFAALGELNSVIPNVRGICGFTEPLWIIRSRYFANVHLRPEGFGPVVNVPKHLKDFLDVHALSKLMGGESGPTVLLEKLLEADPELKSRLAK